MANLDSVHNGRKSNCYVWQHKPDFRKRNSLSDDLRVSTLERKNMKIGYILASGLISAVATAPAMADTADQVQYGYGHMMSGAGHGILGGIMMLAFWGGAIALVVVGTRMFSRHKEGQSKPKALEILRERFAKGELDEEEFHQRKTTLEG